jgi:hypothetical protein
MEPLKALADNFVDPESKHHRHAWYAWTGAALALVAFAAGLYLFYSLAELPTERQMIYFNPNLKITLYYPASWLPNGEFLDYDGLPRRFEGESGWFEVGATSGDGVILTEVAASLNSNGNMPFGQNPQISTVQIAGQPGAVIMPAEDNINQAAAVVAYPEPIQAGFTNYRFLIVKMDRRHLTSLLNSLIFISQANVEIQKLPNIIIYLPPSRAIINSPFEVAGIARVFENKISLKVINGKKQAIWTGFATANAKEVGTYGGFRTTINLSGAEVTAGEQVELQVYQNSALDGKEIDKVIIPLRLREIKPTKIVEVYFGSASSPAGKECESVYALERHVPETEKLADIALVELLKGPTIKERQAGFYTSLPPEVSLNRLVIENGVASVDFNEALERGVAGSCRVQAIRTQIEKTLRQFPSVKEVVISINGRIEDILQP